MEDRERPRGIFSTANGKYAYREARQSVRPIFREDSCFRDDVEDMAPKLRQEFPEECKLMTAADASNVENYFDAVDIQMQSHVFLYEVLMRIVVYNFEEARMRVHEYVNRVMLDPVRYLRLTVDDVESHVFSEEEQDLVGYDNTLPAALNILKQHKFFQAFNEPQRPVGADYGPDSADSLKTNFSDPTPPDNQQAPHFILPATTVIACPPQFRGRRGSSQSDYDRRPSDPHFSMISRSNRRQSTMSYTLLEQTTQFEPMRPDDQMTSNVIQSPLFIPSRPLHLEQAGSQPAAIPYNKPPTAGRGKYSDTPRMGLSDRVVGIARSMPQVPHFRRQGSKGRRHLKGSETGIKNLDDIRRQSIMMNVHTFPPQSFQSRSMPVTTLPSQPPLMQRHRTFPLVPDRMSSVNFSTPFDKRPHQRSPIESALTDSPPPLVPYYPRPEFCRARSETSDAYCRYVNNNGITLQPRVRSNPFPATILEDLEGERNIAAPFAQGYQKARISQYSAVNQQTRSMSSHSPTSSKPRREPLGFLPCPPQSGGVAQSANTRFPSHHGDQQATRQSHMQNQGRGRISNRDHSRNYHHTHHQGFPQEQPYSQYVGEPRDDCILFISGLPEVLDVKAIWHMLSPVHGLKWIAPLKKAQNEGGQISTYLVFYDSSSAAVALDLLPRSIFTAMNGRYLGVCRFNSDYTGPLRSWNPSISGHSPHFVPRVRRFSEPTFPAPGQLGSLHNSPGYRGRPLASQSCGDTESEDSKSQKREIKGPDAENQHPPGQEAMKASEEAFQDQISKALQVSTHSQMTQHHESSSYKSPSGDLRILDGPSTTSTGSPVKRVKRKGPNTPKSERNIPKRLSKEEPTKNEYGTPEHEMQESLAEEMAGQPQLNRKFSGCSTAESVSVLEQTSANEPQTPRRSEKETNPEKAGLTFHSWEDAAHHSSEKVGSVTDQSPAQTSQAKLPLQKSLEDHEMTVHLPLSPKIPQAISPKQTGLIPVVQAAENLQCDPAKDEVRQHSAVPKSREFSSSTNEQRLAAEASQRQFAAAFVHTRLKSKDPNQKGKAQRSSIASKDMYQRPDITTYVAERAVDAKHRPTASTMARHPQHPEPQKLLHHSLATPAIETSHPSPISTGLFSGAHNDSSPRDIDEDVPPKPTRGSTVAKGAPAGTRCRLPMASPTSIREEVGSSSKGDQDTFTMIGTALQKNNRHGGSADNVPETTALPNKLPILDLQREETSQPVKALINQGPPLFQLDILDVPRTSPLLKGEQQRRRLEENTPITTQDHSKKMLMIRESNKAAQGYFPLEQSHKTEFRTSRTSDSKLCLGLGESYNGNGDKTANNTRELTGEEVCPENTVRGDEITVTASYTGLDLQGPLPGRPSPSSVVQTSTASPILTRKKKQKKFFRTQEEPKDGGQKRIVKGLVSSAGGGDQIQKELHHVTEAASLSSIPVPAPNDFVQIRDAKEASSKTEVEDFETLENIFTHSPLSTPPNTPPPEHLSLLESPPITLVAPINNHTETLKNIPGIKSKNRKKNRSGRKKPRNLRQLSLDLHVPVPRLVVADNEQASSTLSPCNLTITPESKKFHLPREAFQDVKYPLIVEAKWENVQGDDWDTTFPSPEFSVKHYAIESFKDDVDISQKFSFNRACLKFNDHDRSHPPRVSSTPRSENAALLRTARGAGYLSPRGVLPIDFPDKPELELGDDGAGRGSKDLTLATELRASHSKAALERIEGLCDYEKEIKDSLHSKILLRDTDHSEPTGSMLQRIMKVQKQDQDAKHKEGTGLDFDWIFGEMSGLERVAALDQELHSIVREAVQMTSPFTSDEIDLENGILYTIESVRAKRVLKVTDFREISPLNTNDNRDTRWTAEWCNEVAQWLHLTVPRIPESQTKAMYEWEEANPSMEQNLMALGFTALEIKQCELLWTPNSLEINEMSPQLNRRSRRLGSRRRSVSDSSDNSSTPRRPSRQSERTLKTGTDVLATASNSKLDPVHGRLKENQGVEPRAQWVAVTGTEIEDTVHKRTDTVETWQLQRCNEEGNAPTGPKLTKSVRSDDEDEPQEADEECKAKSEEAAQVSRVRKKRPAPEEEKADLQKQTPALSFISVDGVVDVGLTGSLNWKTISDRICIAAAIKQNEEDLRGKSSARKYKKVDQDELKTLGLTSPLLTTTTALPSTPPKSNNRQDSSSLGVSGPTETPEPSKKPPHSSPTRQICTDMVDTSIARKTPSMLQSSHVPKPSYATALQSPIRRPQSFPKGVPASNTSNAIVFYAPDPKDNGTIETDAWALREEEAWGKPNCSIGAPQGSGG